MNPEKEHAQIPFKVIIEKNKTKQQNNIPIGNNCASVVKTKMHCADSPEKKGLVAPTDGSAVGRQASAVCLSRLFGNNIDTSPKLLPFPVAAHT